MPTYEELKDINAKLLGALKKMAFECKETASAEKMYYAYENALEVIAEAEA